MTPTPRTEAQRFDPVHHFDQGGSTYGQMKRSADGDYVPVELAFNLECENARLRAALERIVALGARGSGPERNKFEKDSGMKKQYPHTEAANFLTSHALPSEAELDAMNPAELASFLSSQWVNVVKLQGEIGQMPEDAEEVCIAKAALSPANPDSKP